MGVSVLILGVSGTGKSASMRNFAPGDIGLVNVAGKPLPFKGKFEETLSTDDYDKVTNFIECTHKKSIVVDDAQYLMGNEFMRRVTEKGYDKFSELAQNFYNLLETIQRLPDDKIVYLLGHIERDQDGHEKFKTMGKLIDQCINVEGTCTIVLKTCVSDGRYTFLTQNSGKDTVKSPMGMFPSFAIENDLKYVDEKIRTYYGMDGAIPQEEMAQKDQVVSTDVTKEDVGGRKKRRGKAAETDSAAAEEPPKRTRRKGTSDNVPDENPTDTPPAEEDAKTGSDGGGTGDADTPARKRRRNTTKPEDGAGDTGGDVEAKPKRARKTREAVEQENAEKLAQAGMEEAGEEEEVPFDKVEEPKLEQPPRRRRRRAE